MEEVIKEMKTCNQMSNLTVYQHGELVHQYFNDLYFHLKNGTPLQFNWRLPEWIEQQGKTLFEYLLPYDTLKTYQIFHDCGKPFCRVVDEDGKQHFPDHANVSGKLWFQLTGDIEISTLIGMDMDIHLLKAEGIDEFSSRPQAISLLLTGFAELHANASMFGGIESTNFKIKWKNLDKRGKQILKIIMK